MSPPFQPGDLVVPVDPPEMWGRRGFKLTVIECRRSRTRANEWAIKIQVSGAGEPFECWQPAEVFRRADT